MTDPRLFLLELTVVTDLLGSTTVHRYANRPFQTGRSDTPSDTAYGHRILRPIRVKRTMFAPRTTRGRSEVSYGDAVLGNPDGLLDAVFGVGTDLGYDGQKIVQYHGVDGAAYPAGFTQTFRGTMLEPRYDKSGIIVRVRGREEEMNVPFHSNRYAGDNTGGSGLEGEADLKDKPKPKVFGTVFNVTAICVNAAKQIYQVNDGAVSSTVAYDAGIPLTFGLPLDSVTSGFGANAIRALGFNASVGELLAVGAGATATASSDDGATWSSVAHGFGTSQVNDVGTVSAYIGSGGGPFFEVEMSVLVGEDGKLRTSSNHSTWTAQTSGFGATHINGIATRSGPGEFALGPMAIVVGNAGKLYTSDMRDATITSGTMAFTARTSGFGATDINGVAIGDSADVIVGDSGKIAYSTDYGLTWTLVGNTGFGSSDIYRVRWVVDRFFAVGAGNTIGMSVDGGKTWVMIDAGFSGAVRDLAYAIDDFGAEWVIAVGDSGEMAISFDRGATWAQVPVPGLGTAQLNAITAHDGEFIAGGAAGNLGITLTGGGATYANTTDLENDALAPAPGTIGVYAAGGLFRLGASPAGRITCDVIQGAASANRTHGQIYKAVLEQRGLVSGTDFVAADITTLDAAVSGEAGLFVDEETTYAKVLDRIATSIGAAWYPDRTGLYRLKQLLVPSGSAVAAFTENSTKQGTFAADVVKDPEGGLPTWEVIVRYARNYTVQAAGELLGGVTDARRAELGFEWKETKDQDAAIQTKHRLANTLIVDSLFAYAAGAAAEATRVLTLRKTRRAYFTPVVPLNAITNALDLNDVVTLQHLGGRFGLSSALKFRILDIDPIAEGFVQLGLWGGVA